MAVGPLPPERYKQAARRRFARINADLADKRISVATGRYAANKLQDRFNWNRYHSMCSSF